MPEDIYEQMASGWLAGNKKNAATAGKSPAGKYDSLIEKYASASGLDTELVRKMTAQESAGDARAKSWAGNAGLLQVSQDVVNRFVKPNEFGTLDPFNPEVNLAGGTRYFKFLLDRYKGDRRRALAGYNAGEGNADRDDWWEMSQYWTNDQKLRQIPLSERRKMPLDKLYRASTREYIDKILGSNDGDGSGSAPLSQPNPVSLAAIDPYEGLAQAFLQNSKPVPPALPAQQPVTGLPKPSLPAASNLPEVVRPNSEMQAALGTNQLAGLPADALSYADQQAGGKQQIVPFPPVKKEQPRFVPSVESEPPILPSRPELLTMQQTPGTGIPTPPVKKFGNQTVVPLGKKKTAPTSSDFNPADLRLSEQQDDSGNTIRFLDKNNQEWLAKVSPDGSTLTFNVNGKPLSLRADAAKGASVNVSATVGDKGEQEAGVVKNLRLDEVVEQDAQGNTLLPRVAGEYRPVTLEFGRDVTYNEAREEFIRAVYGEAGVAADKASRNTPVKLGGILTEEEFRRFYDPQTKRLEAMVSAQPFTQELINAFQQGGVGALEPKFLEIESRLKQPRRAEDAATARRRAEIERIVREQQKGGIDPATGISTPASNLSEEEIQAQIEATIADERKELSPITGGSFEAEEARRGRVAEMDLDQQFTERLGYTVRDFAKGFGNTASGLGTIQNALMQLAQYKPFDDNPETQRRMAAIRAANADNKTGLQQLGAAMNDWVEETVGKKLNKDIAGDFSTEVFSGAGSLAFFMLTGGISNGIGVSQKLSSGLFGGLMEVGSSYEEMTKKGLSSQEASIWAQAGIPIGASEAFGVGRQLDKLTAGKFSREFTKFLIDTGKEATEEALQEFVQTTSGELLIATATSKDKSFAGRWQTFWESIVPSVKKGLRGAAVGGILGAGSNVAVTGAGNLAEMLPGSEARQRANNINQIRDTRNMVDAALYLQNEQTPNQQTEPQTSSEQAAKQQSTALNPVASQNLAEANKLSSSGEVANAEKQQQVRPEISFDKNSKDISETNEEQNATDLPPIDAARFEQAMFENGYEYESNNPDYFTPEAMRETYFDEVLAKVRRLNQLKQGLDVVQKEQDRAKIQKEMNGISEELPSYLANTSSFFGPENAAYLENLLRENGYEVDSQAGNPPAATVAANAPAELPQTSADEPGIGAAQRPARPSQIAAKPKLGQISIAADKRGQVLGTNLDAPTVSMGSDTAPPTRTANTINSRIAQMSFDEFADSKEAQDIFQNFLANSPDAEKKQAYYERRPEVKRDALRLIYENRLDNIKQTSNENSQLNQGFTQNETTDAGLQSNEIEAYARNVRTERMFNTKLRGAVGKTPNYKRQSKGAKFTTAGLNELIKKSAAGDLETEQTLRDAANRILNAPITKEDVETARINRPKRRAARPDASKHPLWRFVALSGGIREHSSYDATPIKETGKIGLLNNKAGKSAEDMFQSAIEAGYFPSENRAGRENYDRTGMTVDDFLAAIGESAAGVRPFFSTENELYQEMLDEAVQMEIDDFYPVLSKTERIAEFLEHPEVAPLLKKTERGDELTFEELATLRQIAEYEKDLDKDDYEPIIELARKTGEAISPTDAASSVTFPESDSFSLQDGESLYQPEEESDEEIDEAEPEGEDDLDFSFDFGDEESAPPKTQSKTWDTDLFGNALEPTEQTDLFGKSELSNLQNESSNEQKAALARAYGPATADYIAQLLGSSDKDAARVARDLSDAAKLVSAKGAESKQIVEDAADALDIFVTARNSKATVSDIINQPRLDAKQVSQKAEQMALQMADGTFAGKFRRALSEARSEDSLRMAQPTDSSEPKKQYALSDLNRKFAGAVEEFKAGELLPEDEITVSPVPFSIYKALGADPNLPVKITAAVLDKATGSQRAGHDLNVDDLKNLPSLLARPVMVFKPDEGKSGLLAVIDITDGIGNAVTAVVHLARLINRSKVHFIPSIYGKSSAGSQLADWINKDRLLYVDTTKLPAWITRHQHQLLSLVQSAQARSKILTEKDFVKKTQPPATDKDANLNAISAGERSALKNELRLLSSAFTAAELGSEAKAEAVDGVLKVDAAGLALFNRIRADFGVQSEFAGIYLTGIKPFEARAALRNANVSPEFIKEFDEALRNPFGDVAVVLNDAKFPAFSEQSEQEEKAHRADHRTRKFKPQDISLFEELPAYAAAAERLRPRYGASEQVLHQEIIAKSFRDDAESELGLTADEIFDIHAVYIEQLDSEGVRYADISAAFEGISDRGNLFTLQYEQNQRAKLTDAERNRGDGAQPSGIDAESAAGTRTGSNADSQRSSQGDNRPGQSVSDDEGTDGVSLNILDDESRKDFRHRMLSLSPAKRHETLHYYYEGLRERQNEIARGEDALPLIYEIDHYRVLTYHPQDSTEFRTVYDFARRAEDVRRTLTKWENDWGISPLPPTYLPPDPSEAFPASLLKSAEFAPHLAADRAGREAIAQLDTRIEKNYRALRRAFENDNSERELIVKLHNETVRLENERDKAASKVARVYKAMGYLELSAETPNNIKVRERMARAGDVMSAKAASRAERTGEIADFKRAERQDSLALKAQAEADKARKEMRTAQESDDGTGAALRSALPVTFTTEVSELGFFSAAQQAIIAKMPNKARPEQIRGILSPASNGIKQEELEWLRIEEFLTSKDSFSKQEVLDFVRANNAEVREVLKTDKSDIVFGVSEILRETINDKAAQVERFEASPLNSSEFYQVGDLITFETDDELAVRDRSGNLDYFVSREYALNALHNAARSIAENSATSPKYGKYVLPGGKSYKELLLTLPPKETGDEFKSPHFDEKNILAHIRFNERTDAGAGKRTLFIEEIQSDWHQDGRKKGYINETERSRLSKSLAEYGAGDAMQMTIAKLREKNVPEDLIDEFDRVFLMGASQVPNAPFKKSWQELAFKRALRYATENGFDAVAWTTGETQAERYDMSRRVGSVYLNPKTRELYAYAPGVDPSQQNGAVYASPLLRDENVSDAQLTELIGKDATKKLLESEIDEFGFHSIKGDSLSVGGGGMKGFYSQILPAFVNKYVKKWGAKVTDAQVSVGDNKTATAHSVEITPKMRESVMSGQSLWMATDKAATKRISEVFNAPLIEILGQAEAVAEGYRVRGNAEFGELMRRIEQQKQIDVFGDKAKAIGVIGGEFLEPFEVKDRVKRLKKIAADAKEKGYDKEAKNIEAIAAAFSEAARNGDGTALPFVLDEALPHEEFHKAGYAAAGEKLLESRHALLNRLYNLPAAQKAWKNLLRKNGTPQQPAVIVEETAAWIADGRINDLGITEDEALDFLELWFKSYVIKQTEIADGKRTPAEILEDFQNPALERHVREMVDYLIATGNFTDEQQEAINEQTNAPVSGTNGRELPRARDGLPERNRSEKQQPDASEGEPARSAAPESRRASETSRRDKQPDRQSGRIKLRSLPGTLRRAGLEAADAAYTIFGNEEGIREGKRLLNELGLNGAVRRLVNMSNPGKEDAVLSFMVQRVLLNEIARLDAENKKEEATRYRRQLAELQDWHAELATRAGQFNQAASIAAQSAEGVMYVANKMLQLKFGKNTTLTPEDHNRLLRKAESAEEAIAQATLLERETKRLKKRLEKLKEEKTSPTRKSKGRHAATRRNRAATLAREQLKQSLPDVLARLKAQLGATNAEATLKMALPTNAGLSEQILNDLGQVGAYYLLEGLPAMSPAEFDAAMIDSFGDQIRDSIRDIHARALKAYDAAMLEARKTRLREQLAEEFPDLSETEINDLVDEKMREKAERRALQQGKKAHVKVARSHGYQVKKRPRQSNKTRTPKLTTDDLLKMSDADLLKAMRVLTEANRAKILKKLGLENATRAEQDEALQRRAEKMRTRAKQRAKLQKRLRDLSPKVRTRPPLAERRLMGAIKNLASNDRIEKIANWLNAPEKFLREQIFQKVETEFGLTGTAAREAVREARSVLEAAKAVVAKQAEQRKIELAGGEKDYEKLQAARWKARRAKEKAQQAVADELKRIRNGEFRYRVGQVFDLVKGMRELMASGDLSAPLRQGLFFMLSAPEKQGKALQSMFGSFKDENYGKVIQAIEDEPRFVQAAKAGVDFSQAGQSAFSLTRGEEDFRSKIIEKIPILQTVLTGWSERTYTAFLDSQRMIMWNTLAAELEAAGQTAEDNPQAFKAIANFINIATGRGVVGDSDTAKKIANLLNGLPLFAPRYVLSRFQMLYYLTTAGAAMPKGTKLIVAKRVGRFYGMVALVLGAAYLAGASISFDDPDDDDFLKIKVGNYRYDFLGGMQQPARFLLRLGKQAFLEEPGKRGRKMVDVTARFVRSKMNPLGSLAWDATTGKTWDNRDFSIFMNYGEPIWSRITPLLWQDIVKNTIKDGAGGALATAPGAFGIGVQNYEDKPENKKAETKEKLVERGRSGESIKKDLQQKIKTGEIKRNEAATIEKKAVLTDSQYKMTSGKIEDDLKAVSEMTLADRAMHLPILEARALRGTTWQPEQRRRVRELVQDFRNRTLAMGAEGDKLIQTYGETKRKALNPKGAMPR
jgi:hypothetical protein